jgi:hypothetical protein
MWLTGLVIIIKSSRQGTIFLLQMTIMARYIRSNGASFPWISSIPGDSCYQIKCNQSQWCRRGMSSPITWFVLAIPRHHQHLTNTAIFQVGLAFNQTGTQWLHDITTASAASIDGFALNIGAADTFTLTALGEAYKTAASFKNFSLFLSFDFSATGGWSIDTIANLTNTFKDEPAQFKVDRKPLVSTFEGTSFAETWKLVREKVDGGIYLVPDWASLGPDGVGKRANLIDGACEYISSGRFNVVSV